MSDLLVNVDGASETEMFRMLFSDYAKCKHGTCAADAEYLAICYRCDTSHPICGECKMELPQGETAVVVLAGSCDHIVLTAHLTVVPRR